MSRNPDAVPPGEAGFSIVETLVALFVFGLAGVALIQMQSASVRNAQRSETLMLANLAAQNVLVDAMASNASPDLGKRTGEMEMAGRRWRWTIDVQRSADPSTLQLKAEAVDASDPGRGATAVAFRTQ